MAFDILAGAAGTATIPGGSTVRSVRCHNTTGGGSLVITTNGGSALPSITIPAASGWLELEFGPNELVPGTTLVFTGTDAYAVVCRGAYGI